MRFRLLVLVASFAASACRPEFGERESHVDRTRVLAVRIDPPEAKPGEPVVASILVASKDGTAEAPEASWAFCATPKLLTENGAVSAACLHDGVVPLGSAPGHVTATLPANACFAFGPETQSADVRPRDPDVTGGFFQPIRVIVGGSDGEPVIAFGFSRITCNLANANADVAARFHDQYTANRNPTLLPLDGRTEGGAPVALDAVPRGARVVLRASWPPEDAEVYAALDTVEQTIVMRRESMRVSWYASAGTFEHDRSGRNEDELETFTDDVWTAPGDAERAYLWAVLRDARGGVAFLSIAVTTR